MNAQERALLEDFLDRLIQTRDIRKVPEADEMIRKAVEQQPDAAYLLVQRALLLTQALEQAKARIATLESTENRSNSTFLGTGSSSWSPSTAGYPTPPTQATAQAGPSVPPPSGWAPSAPAPSGGASSFLGKAAATAAGVAGGAFLFEGIESLLGRHEGGFGSPPPGDFPSEDVTINNNYYYPDESRPREASGTDRADFEDDDISSADTDDPNFTADDDVV